MKMSKQKFTSQLNEFELVNFIKKNNTKSSNQHNIFIDIGDDCFGFSSKNEKFLVTTDILIEDIHFKTKWSSPSQIAQKAVEVNVSDVASMGGAIPLYMFISIGIEKHTQKKFVEELFNNIKKTAQKYSIYIAGGDTVCADKLTISITLIAKSYSKIITRTASKTNDIICTTGTFGDSRAGLEILQSNKHKFSQIEKFLINKHIEPKAKLQLAHLMIDNNIELSSMTDSSDGLFKSIELLTTDNNKGAIINLEKIPTTHQLKHWITKSKKNIYDYALNGGEEFELVFTINPSSKQKLHKLIPSVSFIGIVDATKEVKYFENGTRKEIKYNGYKHF